MVIQKNKYFEKTHFLIKKVYTFEKFTNSIINVIGKGLQIIFFENINYAADFDENDNGYTNKNGILILNIEFNIHHYI